MTLARSNCGSLLALTVALSILACTEAGEAVAVDAGAAEMAEQEQVPQIALPGAEPFPPDFQQRLWQAYRNKGPDYEPRTEHLHPDGSPLYVNRLILEDSPYLIQHAHNPVNWFAWGAEAFDKARREGKPVFLSIGYSTCHWCHVMETESFDNEEVAQLLNQGFVAIKVDRERRPDVDEIYMTAVQLLTRRGGGWPMSTLLTPDGKPFFGGTYIPRQGFMELLRRAETAWREQRPQLVAQAERVTEAVRQVTSAAGEAAEVGEKLIAAAVRQSLEQHDPHLGGFSGAPKFPRESQLLFLLERVLRTGDREALAAVETALDHMARGGIYDQVGGGFHRYSTDERWLVPHFEKMLYNQAHLARAYLEAYRITADPIYERVARQTLDYVLRDMSSPEGGFYSATDADSEGKEGEFFVWTPAEIREVLPAAEAELAIRLFGVAEDGNFEGKSILHLPKPLPAAAHELGLSLQQLFARLDRIRERLYQAREERIHPLRDEKIVTAWNGMMMSSLARAADLLSEGRYLQAAERAAAFLWDHNLRDDGALWRVHLKGSSSIDGNLEDYAYLTEALVSLYDATGEGSWLARAKSVAQEMVDRFWDSEGGGFFLSAGDEGGRLIARPKSPSDGAIPSGNSVAVRSLALLSARSGEVEPLRKAEATLGAFSGRMRQQPTAFAYMLLGADELLHGAAGPLEYGANGVVRAKVELASGAEAGALAVHLETAAGWHVNAHEPLQENLIPTRLAVAEGGDGVELTALRYPPPETVTLGFQDEPLAVYQGSAPIHAQISAEGARPPAIARLRLTVQACDDRQCLKPEDLVLELPVPAVVGDLAVTK